jgi:hypothetical protein
MTEGRWFQASGFGLQEKLAECLTGVLHLVTLMATSMSDVPAARRRDFADAANQIRWHRGGIGP